jgi:hypothetical protein
MDIRPEDDRLPYYEERSPGGGTLPARAWYAGSDAARLSLNGAWAFRLISRFRGPACRSGRGGWRRGCAADAVHVRQALQSPVVYRHATTAAPRASTREPNGS